MDYREKSGVSRHIFISCTRELWKYGWLMDGKKIHLWVQEYPFFKREGVWHCY